MKLGADTPKVMPPLHLLLIEESTDDATQVTLALANAGFEVQARRVDTPDTLVNELASGHWDVAISDYELQQLSAEKALAIVREHGADLPFIFVSGKVGEDIAVEAMRIGAQD